jgi:translocation and assembly module TamA
VPFRQAYFRANSALIPSFFLYLGITLCDFFYFYLLFCLSAAAAPSLELVLDYQNNTLKENIKNTLTPNLRCDAIITPFLENTLKKQTQDALEALGFYHSEIIINLSQKEDCLAVKLAITIGEVTQWRQVQIEVLGEMAELPEVKKLLSDLPLKKGEALHHGRYDTLRGQLQDLAQKNGFFTAEFIKREILIYPDEKKADIALILDSGPRFHLGAITLNATPFHPKFLERLQILNSEDPYSLPALQAQQQRLLASGYFDNVTFTSEKEGNTVNLTIDALARKRRYYEGSIGVASDIGVRSRFYYENRYVNPFGYTFNVLGELSLPRQALTLNYQQPLGDPLTEKQQFSLLLYQEEIDGKRSQGSRLQWSRSRQRGFWQRTLFVNADFERFRLENTWQNSRLLRPGIAYVYRQSDDLLTPKQAKNFSVEVSASVKPLSNVDFLLLKSRFFYLRPLGKKQSFFSETTIGAIYSDDFTKVPLSLRFFAGGDNSVRGFAYQSLSPQGEGGRYLLTQRLELERMLLEKHGIAVFYDVGNSFNDWEKLQLAQSFGVGWRWRLPIGTLRLDLAFPLNQRNTPRLHFSFGSR